MKASRLMIHTDDRLTFGDSVLAIIFRRIKRGECGVVSMGDVNRESAIDPFKFAIQKIHHPKPNKSRFVERYVYLIDCRMSAAVKVGIAANVKKRMAAIQVGNPYPINVRDTFKVSDEVAEIVESQCHELLRFERLQGEWFRDGEAVNQVQRVLGNVFK